MTRDLSEWSRPLPSVPSSCTVIREADGLYYASFVVDRDPAPLPRTDREVGVDLGLDQLAVIGEKAAHHGRTVIQIGRWYPSSQLCSACGHRDGPKPLTVRSWTCPACGTDHDRDLNAARNILAEGRRVAAGLADTVNACGGDVRPGPVPAVAGEAGTHRGVA
jgi:putative transposase